MTVIIQIISLSYYCVVFNANYLNKEYSCRITLRFFIRILMHTLSLKYPKRNVRSETNLPSYSRSH